MCDLIKVSSIQILAVVERLYAAPILCGARRDLALESGILCILRIDLYTAPLPRFLRHLIRIFTLEDHLYTWYR
jgi:hypothetical protein